MSIRPLTEELQKKAIEELNEDPKRIQDDIKHIKDWLAKQPHLKARTEDQWLLSFLRGCKFSLERTKEKLDMYHTVRAIAPECYGIRDPMLPEIQEILKQGLFLPLKKSKDSSSPRVILFRVGAFNPNLVINDLFKVNGMLSDILLNEDDQLIIAGLCGIQDMKGITMAHMTIMTPSHAKKSMTIFPEAMPTRPKEMHYINIPSFFETMMSVFKPFLKEKLLKRMIVHTSDKYDDIYKSIPKSILPNEYGGDAGPVQELVDYWKNKVESYRDWFLDDAKYTSDESKRPGKPKTTNEVFGIEGSFRKLNVD